MINDKFYLLRNNEYVIIKRYTMMEINKYSMYNVILKADYIIEI